MKRTMRSTITLAILTITIAVAVWQATAIGQGQAPDRSLVGWSEYSFKFVHFRRNVSTGAFAGKQEGSGALELSASGDEFTTDGGSQVFDVDDNPVGTGGCSNSIGTRFKLDF